MSHGYGLDVENNGKAARSSSGWRALSLAFWQAAGAEDDSPDIVHHYASI
jgi:hypothetical protein